MHISHLIRRRFPHHGERIIAALLVLSAVGIVVGLAALLSR